jgi:hypothetical protein
MATGVARSVSAPRVSRRWRIDRAFFTGLSVLMVVAVFSGFSRSYYLKGLYGTPSLPTLFHIHGLLFTDWSRPGVSPFIVNSASPAARSPP